MRFVGVDLPLGPVLATLAILTCALVLGHVREVSQRRTAEEKALTLLKQWLSPAELAQYEKYSYFEVTGGDSGKRYRIRPSRQMNVEAQILKARNPNSVVRLKDLQTGRDRHRIQVGA